jgi:protein-disulfide isomerase
MKRRLFAFLIPVLILSAVAGAHAQEATVEATAEATAEATVEPTAPTTEELQAIFRELPQTRLEDGGFVVGNPDAPITIVEFSDFACPHCLTYRATIDRIIVDYVATGQAKFEFRVFPTAGGQMTAIAAFTSECAETVAPGSYWHSYGTLYDMAAAQNYSVFLPLALVVALDADPEAVLQCIETQETAQVLVDIALGQSLGVTGTPAVAIRDSEGTLQWIEYEGQTFEQGGVAYEVLAAVIEAAQSSD